MIGRVPVGQLIPWWMALEIYICIFFAIIASRLEDKKIMLFSLVLSMILIPFVISFLNLANLSIFKISELVSKEESEMLKYKNFGRKSLTELVEKLSQLGLSFGMDIKDLMETE